MSHYIISRCACNCGPKESIYIILLCRVTLGKSDVCNLCHLSDTSSRLFGDVFGDVQV